MRQWPGGLRRRLFRQYRIVRLITVYFGVFGHRTYRMGNRPTADFRVIDSSIGALQIPCRWCVGEGMHAGCVACKGTGWMWVSA